MENYDDICLTDAQYLSLINKLKEIASTPDFNPAGDDCNITGMKSTESNCGLCNEELTTLETALFPDDFIKRGRKSMKYCKDLHKCPLDMRTKAPNGFGTSCFYSCVLFAKRFKDIRTPEKIRELILNFKPLVEAPREDTTNVHR